jgi:hypothetical protein
MRNSRCHSIEVY